MVPEDVVEDDVVDGAATKRVVRRPEVAGERRRRPLVGEGFEVEVVVADRLEEGDARLLYRRFVERVQLEPVEHDVAAGHPERGAVAEGLEGLPDVRDRLLRERFHLRLVARLRVGEGEEGVVLVRGLQRREREADVHLAARARLDRPVDVRRARLVLGGSRSRKAPRGTRTAAACSIRARSRPRRPSPPRRARPSRRRRRGPAPPPRRGPGSAPARQDRAAAGETSGPSRQARETAC